MASGSAPRPSVACLLLGSNVDKERNIVRAVELLAERVRVRAVSSVYETAPAGRSDQERFLNAAVLVETDLSPDALKREVLSAIEARLGRRRTADRNAPRTIDLDIVFWNDEVVHAGGRTIPDPELLTRGHVAVPVAELLPDSRHPVTGEPLREIAARLTARGGPHRRGDLDLARALRPFRPMS